MDQLMPLALIVSCFSKIQISCAFLVLAHPDSPGQRAVKWMCACVHVKTCKRAVMLRKDLLKAFYQYVTQELGEIYGTYTRV